MSEQDIREQGDPAERSFRRQEIRAARVETTEYSDSAKQVGVNASDDPQVASEPMIHQRLVEAAPPPAGRQRTGDPPAPGGLATTD